MKYDLKDVAFLIALRIDRDDRLYNINITIKYLLKNFLTNIILI